jgi:hypothetical protein
MDDLVSRIRSIHPDICIDEKLAEMDNARVERTFMRLWTYCDDDGRALDNPRLIKAALYPLLDSMTVEAVEEDIALLTEKGFVIRYESAGREYLFVPSFAKWQRPNRKVESKYPAPPHGVSSEDAVSTQCDAPPVVVVVDGDVEGVVVVGATGASARTPKGKKSAAPKDFRVTAEMRAWASENGADSIDLDRETQQFLDDREAKGVQYVNWTRGWQTWIRNQVKWDGERHRPASTNGKGSRLIEDLSGNLIRVKS